MGYPGQSFQRGAHQVRTGLHADLQSWLTTCSLRELALVVAAIGAELHARNEPGAPGCYEVERILRQRVLNVQAGRRPAAQ